MQKINIDIENAEARMDTHRLSVKQDKEKTMLDFTRNCDTNVENTNIIYL